MSLGERDPVAQDGTTPTTVRVAATDAREGTASHGKRRDHHRRPRPTPREKGIPHMTLASRHRGLQARRALLLLVALTFLAVGGIGAGRPAQAAPAAGPQPSVLVKLRAGVGQKDVLVTNAYGTPVYPAAGKQVVVVCYGTIWGGWWGVPANDANGTTWWTAE